MDEPLGKCWPWLQVPQDYRPASNDDFSTLAGLDVVIAIDDTASAFLVGGLSARILAVNPRRLLIYASRNKTILLPEGGNMNQLH
ncbi:hypothetical protein ACTMU2_38460 [Cupriavidus basilensis]